MSALPGIGSFSYNGIVFSGPLVNTTTSITPVRTDDDRATTHYDLTIDVVATVDTGNCGFSPITLAASGSDYLYTMTMIHAMLSQDGGPLVIRDKMLTVFAVNDPSVAGSLIDVNFGPRVKVASFVPLLGNKAFQVTMSITTSVGQCPILASQFGDFSKSWDEGDVKQVSYTVAWEGNDKGYSSRTVQGFVEVVMKTLLANQSLTFSADDYRDYITISCPTGFRRVVNAWNLVARRNRIEFTVRDQEIESPNAFPPGVVDIDVSHQVSIGASAGWTKGMNTLSGHCEVANSLSTLSAWERLYPIIDSRINAARTALGGLFLTSVEVTETIFSRRVDFSITYYKLGSSPFGFLASSGMFTPTPGTWSDWRASMYGPDADTNGETYVDDLTGNEVRLPWARRSVANMSFEPSDDKLVTPCSNQPIAMTVHNQRFEPWTGRLSSAIVNTCPLRTASYLVYRSILVSEVEGTAGFMQEMPTAPFTDTADVPETADGNAIAPASYTDVQQGRVIDPSGTSPMLTFRLVGMASRVGYPVELPKVASQWVRTVKMVTDGSSVTDTDITVLGCKLYMKAWSLKYKVPKKLADAATDLGSLTQTIFGTSDNPAGDISDIS